MALPREARGSQQNNYIARGLGNPCFIVLQGFLAAVPNPGEDAGGSERRLCRDGEIGGQSANRPPDGRGHFFAIDRRAWAIVCTLGMAAAVSYLVLSRGSGGDQRTTSWSINAIEKYTGIGRPRAQAAVKALERAGLVRLVQKGSRPRYYIVPAHEVPGCEGRPHPCL